MTIQNHIVNAAKKIATALKEIPISDLLKYKRNTSFKPLVGLNENTSIKDMLKALQENDILAAPIYRVQDNQRVYTGIISVYDIVSFAVFEEIFDSAAEFNESNLFDFLNRIDIDEFFSTPVSKLIGSSDESACPWIVYSTDNLDDLARIFTLSSQHRVLVVDSDILISSLTGPIPSSASLSIVSQSDLVRYLHASRQGSIF